jgi:hypothetical protein
LQGLFDLFGFMGVDAACLAVPNIESAPVVKIGSSGYALDCALDVLTASARLS